MTEPNTYSEIHEQFAFEIAFNHVHSLIERRSHLTKNSGEYIKLAKDYFKSAVKSLDSMINREKKESYHFTPYLNETIGYFGKNLPKTNQEAIELKDKFSSIISNLDNLKRNPGYFYTTDSSKEISNAFEKLSLMYRKYSEEEANREIEGDD
jgi:hypothetical protein